MKTYNIIFNSENDSNDLGFKKSRDYCIDYIRTNNGTNFSYFGDYKGGVVSVVCNETGETVWETDVF